MLSPKHIDMNPILVIGLPTIAIFAGLEVAASLIPWLFAFLGAATMIIFIVGATIPSANFSLSRQRKSLKFSYRPKPVFERLATWVVGLSFVLLTFLGQPLVMCLAIPLTFFMLDKQASLTWDEYVSNIFQKATLQALALATATLLFTGFFQVTLLEQIIVLVSAFFFTLQIYFWRWRANANQGADL
jgi:hypothetical protein